METAKPHSGYKVIFVPFSGGKPNVVPVVDVLSGFLDAEGKWRNGRSQSVVALATRPERCWSRTTWGNIIWRVTPARGVNRRRQDHSPMRNALRRRAHIGQ